MAAPILWAPGKNALFLQEKPMSIKFLVLGGGGYFGFWGGGGVYTRDMGTICPFGVFPLFYSIFHFKIGHFPL